MARGDVKRALRERAILDAAYAHLREQGYVEMSMDDVARACGIGKATLYQHFASKDDLVVAVIVDQMKQGDARFEALDPEAPALTQIRQLLQYGIAMRTRYAPIRVSQAPPHLAHHPLFREEMRRRNQAISAILDRGKARGEVRVDIPTPVLVAHLMQTLGPGLDQTAEVLGLTPEALADQLLDIVVRGFAAG